MRIMWLGVLMTPCNMQKTLFATAYYYNDDPEYNRLRTMFSKDHKNPTPEVEVIVISSSSEDAMYSLENIDYMDIDNEEEEVNSLAVFPKPTVRRKLFDEDDPAKVMDSTTSPRIHFIDVAPGPSFRARYENTVSQRLALNEGGKLPHLSPAGSSCVSNSRMGYWRPSENRQH